uniref:Alpha/beta hydrolase n=1 Tax=Streptomyces sp. NBC_00049 TaxID=2903617 RepID=A0AAU2JNK3_9ACTN
MPRTRTGTPIRRRTRHRFPFRPRTVAVAAVCVLASAVLGAVPGPEPTGGDLRDRSHGRGIRWGACPGQPVPAGMRCATVEVPLDHAATAGRSGTFGRTGTVGLAVARIPATDRSNRIGSLLLNFGGPGGSGIATLAADPKAFARLGERYDLVAFDPRGVGHSEPVSCGGSQETGDGVGPDATARLAALRAVARRCELASGPVLPYVGTVNVSRDMDVLRRALGDDKLNYLGSSYGTRLGAVYAAQFPKSTGRMVLDGVDGLTEPLAEQALVAARGQQRALDAFLAWCAGRPGCAYGTDARAGRDKVAALVARLDEEPLTGADGSYLTGQDAVGRIAHALTVRRTWPALAEALSTADRDRDPAGLLRLGGPAGPAGADRAEPEDQGPGTVPADNAEAASAAVNCADDPGRSNGKAAPAALAKELAALEDEFRKASDIFGPSRLLSVLSCYGRPAGTDFIRRIDRPGGPRMLLVGTRGDPAAPYEWTRETAERLGPAVIVDHEGHGHAGYAASRCVRGYVDGFLIDGRLPAGSRSCPAGE